MGVCETYQNTKKIQKRKNKSYLPFCAKIHSSKGTYKLSDNTINTVSQIDIPKYKTKPTSLYRYKSIYDKKDDQTTLIAGSLHDIQGNSLMNIGTRNSREITSLEETMNESSEAFEIISDGKVDKERVKQSNDKNTIDNYIEFIDDKDNSFYKNNKFDIYKKK